MDDVTQALREEIEVRKKAEADLRELLQKEREAGDARFRSFFESSPQATVAIDPEGRIMMVNRRAEGMFGYDRSEMLRQPLSMLIPERFRPVHAWHQVEYFKKPLARTMGAPGIALAGRRKDGSDFPAEIALNYVETGEGVIALGIVTDITRRKQTADQLARAHAELRASEAQLRSYFEAASQGILAVSNDGRIVLVNRRTEEMFGYTREELIGQELEILLPERYRGIHTGHRGGFFREPRMRAMGTGMDLSGRRKDGSEFPVEIGLSLVEGDDGILALGLVSDTTERKQNTDRLAQVNGELRRSNQELEQFAYVASHDLQEPLRTIGSYLQLLAHRYRGKFDTDADEFITYAVDGAERMKKLIQDLLNFSRAGTQQAHFQSISTQTILNDTLVGLKVAIEEAGAQITSDALPTVVGDPRLLGQVFQNLIGNALKFHRGNRPEVHIAAERNGKDWVFSVRDNGIGVEPQYAERIFQIFQRLHAAEVYSGTGIGLAISRKIVERHGGRIWLESRTGQGSTFFFTIPAEAGESANRAISARQA